MGKKGTFHGYILRISEEEEDGLSIKVSIGYNLEDCRKVMVEFMMWLNAIESCRKV